MRLAKMMTPLTLRCPHCGSTRSDDLECLSAGGPDLMRCENPACFMSFAFLVHECSTCAGDSVYTWKEMPTKAALAQLVCQHCAEPVREAASEAKSEDPTQRT